MAKRRRESEYGEAAAMVDTSLDTRFAILVSMSDTVSDFKRKVELEHVKFYPEVGEIKIHSLKAKRRGNFYPLSDVMLVSSAFHGAKGNWFLSADVSSTLNQKSLEPGASEGLKMDAGSTSNGEKNLSSERTIGLEVEKSSEVAQDLQRNSYLVEDCLEDYRPKKKRRMSQHADVCDSPLLEDNDTLIHESVKVTSQLEIVGRENSVVNVVKDSPEGILSFSQQGTPFISEEAAEVSSRKNDQPDIDDRVFLEGGVVPAATENGSLGSTVNLETPLPFDRRKENIVLENIILENPMAGKSYELGINDQTALSEGVNVEEPNLATGLVDRCGTLQDSKSNGNRKKKKKAKKTAAKVQDTPDLKHEVRTGDSIDETYLPVVTSQSERSAANFQNILAADGMKENIVLESVIPEKSRAGISENELVINVRTEPSQDMAVNKTDASMMDISGIVEAAKSDGRKKKKKKAKKIASGIQDICETTIDKSVEEACETAPTEKGVADSQDILASDGMKENIVLESVILENSRAGISENEPVKNVNTEHALDMTVNQTDVSSVDATMKDARSDGRKRKKKKSLKNAAKIQDSLDEKHETKKNEFLQLYTETHRYEKNEEESQLSPEHDQLISSLCSQILDHVDPDMKQKEANFSSELLDANKVTGPILSEKKKKKKRKKSADTNLEKSGMELTNNGMKNQLPASDAQGTLPINDQKVGNEFLATEDNLNSFMNPEQEQGLIASSQILFDINREKPEEMHGIAVTTDDQEISFKQYFVPGERQDAVASGNKVKEATKSNGKRKTKKKVESHNLPLVSTSSEQQNSLRSGGNHKSESKSRVKSRRHGDSALSSDSSEVGHKAIHTSSRDSGNGGQGFSPREKQEIMTTEKHNEILAASLFTKEKNTSLVKLSSERSKTSPENRDKMVTRAKLKTSLFAKPRSIFDDNSFDSHGTDKMVMKTPAKKNLLTKQGSIFQDNSGEGSGDENESVHSDAGTRSQSDSSSQSEGESDWSEHSTRNGSKLSNGGNGRLTNRKNKSKLDLSASKDLTMDMILRSSNQFKKAQKLLASQTDLEQIDSQQIEFVPDTQPNP